MPVVSMGMSWLTSLTFDEMANGAPTTLFVPHGEVHNDLYLHWHTYTGTDWAKSFNVSVAWRFVPKTAYGIGDTGWTTYADGLWSQLDAASECHPSTSDGFSGYDWWVNLGHLGEYRNNDPSYMAPSGTSVQQQLAPDGWGFAQRKYDFIELKVSIRVIWQDGIDEATLEAMRPYERFSQTLLLVAQPKYTLAGVQYDARGVVVNFTATDWHRSDDRWGLNEFVVAKEDLSGEDLAISPGYYGTIDKPAGDPLTTDTGRLTLPPEAFTRLPLPGDAIQRLRIRMNTPVLPIETEWAWIEGIADVGDTAVCDTPTLTLVSSDSDKVVVRVGTTSDKDNPPDAVHVAFAGASEWHVVALGDEVTLPCPPLGAPITVQAYGTTDEGGVSGIATLEVAALPDVDWLIIAPVDASAGDPVRMRFNVKSDWTRAAEMTVVKLSGRERESAFFGEGGTASGTVTCDILDRSSYGDLYQPRAAFEGLAYAGPCVLRGPDGERRYVAVESVVESWDTVRHVKTMKVSVREVS